MNAIGITGSRHGASKRQLEAVRLLLDRYRPRCLHHGDCVGVDQQVARLADSMGIRLVCHPPLKTELRAWVPSAETLEPKNYLDRNREIVLAVELLIAVPHRRPMYERGGTAYTVNFAKAQARRRNAAEFLGVHIVWPDGSGLLLGTR